MLHAIELIRYATLLKAPFSQYGQNACHYTFYLHRATRFSDYSTFLIGVGLPVIIHQMYCSLSMALNEWFIWTSSGCSVDGSLQGMMICISAFEVIFCYYYSCYFFCYMATVPHRLIFICTLMHCSCAWLGNGCSS